MKNIKKLFEEIRINEQLLFQDMDGCLCDIDKGFEDRLGVSIKKYSRQYGMAVVWDEIESWGSEFWENLPWMPDGKELWNYVKKYNPIILSAANADYQFEGKIKWLKREIGYSDTPVYSPNNWKSQSNIIFNTEKYKFITSPKDILIDDLMKNISLWVASGGIGILHNSAQNTIQQLKDR
jgi:hypothetical protein